MKKRGWIMMSGAAALTLLTLQPAVAHDSWSGPGYSGQMGMPGNYGPGNCASRDHDGWSHHGSKHHRMMDDDGMEGLDIRD